LTTCPYFDNLKSETFDAAVLCATLSRLSGVLGDFLVSTDTLVQNVFLVFWSLPFFHWNWTCLWHYTYGVVPH